MQEAKSIFSKYYSSRVVVIQIIKNLLYLRALYVGKIQDDKRSITFDN